MSIDEVRLVFAWSRERAQDQDDPDADPDADPDEDDTIEPLIAVVASEDEAGAIERELIDARTDLQRVAWEELLVYPGTSRGSTSEGLTSEGSTSDEQADTGPPMVHVVLHAGIEVIADGLDEPAGPVPVSVHASREAAEAEAAATGDPDIRVTTYPLGWRRPGWPFERTAPLPEVRLADRFR